MRARRLAVVAALGLLAALAGAALGLRAAHREMAALDPALPALAEMRRFADEGDLPERLSWIETSRQQMPRRLVLEPSRDPHPDEPYAMAHAVFVLEWADGRRLLVDAGMEREAARAFGRPLAWLGAAPIEPLTTAADALAPVLSGVAPGALGIVFTHLHVDHVDGVAELCRVIPPRVRLRAFQREAQATRTNHTTRPARTLLEAAPCVERVRLGEAPAAPVPGFPGVFVIDAAGHTPGAQVIGAFVRTADGPRGFLLAGDVANALDGVLHDVPKPRAYRLFVVPEHGPRQQRLRRFLRAASEQGGFAIHVAHDQRALVASGLPRWSAPRPIARPHE